MLVVSMAQTDNGALAVPVQIKQQERLVGMQGVLTS